MLPACCTGSRLHSPGEIELPTKEPMVGFDNIRTDAGKPLPNACAAPGRSVKKGGTGVRKSQDVVEVHYRSFCYDEYEQQVVH